MDHKKLFAERLCELKERTGIELWEDICEMTGIAYSTMMQYSTGKIMPRVEVLIKIADYFAVPLDYLTGRLDEDACKELIDDYPRAFMIVRREAYEQFYAKARKRMDIPEGYEAPWPYNLYDDVNETETNFLLTEDQKDGMFKAIDSLRERERVMLLMRYNAGYSLREIGDKYNLTPERVRQIIRKAVFKLRHSSRKDLMNYGLSGIDERNKYKKEIAELGRMQAEIEMEIERYKNELSEQHVLLKKARETVPEIDMFALPLYDMDLSVRAFNCLARYNCETSGDAYRMFLSGDLMKIRNLGKVTAREIRNKLKEIGFDVEIEKGIYPEGYFEKE